jgi:retron-type reverse transcriptase
MARATVKEIMRNRTGRVEPQFCETSYGFRPKRSAHDAMKKYREYANQGYTYEGAWSLLRSWLRLHRGVSQKKLPFYLAFFEFVHIFR